jgi:hypothetical protein
MFLTFFGPVCGGGVAVELVDNQPPPPKLLKHFPEIGCQQKLPLS